MWCKYLDGPSEYHKQLCNVRFTECVCCDKSEKEIRECARVSPLSGYLSPDGKFTECPYYGHMDCATKLVKNDFNLDISSGVKAEEFLLRNGYIGFYARTVAAAPSRERDSEDITPQQREFLEKALSFCPLDEKKMAIELILDEKEALKKLHCFINE